MSDDVSLLLPGPVVGVGRPTASPPDPRIRKVGTSCRASQQTPVSMRWRVESPPLHELRENGTRWHIDLQHVLVIHYSIAILVHSLQACAQELHSANCKHKRHRMSVAFRSLFMSFLVKDGFRTTSLRKQHYEDSTRTGMKNIPTPLGLLDSEN